MSAARRRPVTVEVPPIRLNPTDATLWDIERNPTLRTTIVAALVLDRPADPDRLLDGLEVASRLIHRLRMRVVANRAGIGVPHFEIDPGFDLVDHVRFVEAGVDGVDAAAIASVAETLASTPLDRSRPLWECVYVGGATGRSVLLLKVHHSLTDGVGGIDLLDVVLDRRRRTAARDLDAIPVPCAGHRERPGDQVDRAIHRAVAAPFDAADVAVTTAFHPRRTLAGLVEGTRSAARLLAPTSAPLSPLLVGRSMERRVGTTDVDLERLHRAAARHGCTINHAFFAGTIGGIAAYHRALDAPADRLRVTMPVSLRRSDDPDAGNRWAPVRFVVPTDVDGPVERMLAMAELVRTRRRERALSFSQTLAGLVQVLPASLSSGIVTGMMHGIDVTLTNVPGLTEPHFLAGAAVERIYAFAPTAGAALNAGFVSHLGTGCIGVLSDAAAVTDPALLQDLIGDELESLVDAATSRAPSTPRPEPAARTARAPERLSALDAGFLRLETPETPMHIGGVFLLEGGPLRDPDGSIRLDDLRRHIEARVRRLPRFTRRLAEVPLGVGRPVWVDDDDFDIRRHVRLTAAPGPGGLPSLLERCAELFRDPLDRGHPLWELWFVDGLGDGRIGIVEKVHHALIDGISGVELAAALFDPEPVPVPDEPVRAAPAPVPSGSRLLADALAGQLSDPVGTTARAVSTMWRAPDRVASQVGSALAAAGELVRRDARAPRTRFNRPVGGHRVLRAVTIDVDDVHRIRAPSGATVNDVVLAVVTGAVRTWFLTEHDQPVDVHVLVPVSTRHESMRAEPGNHVGGVVVELPVGEPDPRRRLEIVQERMARLKATREGEGTAAVLDALDHVPPAAADAITRLVAVQPFVNLVVTNVLRSPVPLHLLGARIEAIVPVVPLGPNLGLGIAILTYVDRMTISISADPDACPDVDVLATAIHDELAALADAVPVP